MAYKFKGHFTYRALIDITPLIDLAFNLIIFFMVSSTLGTQTSITVHLPKAVQSGDERSSTLVVSITEKNEIYLNDVRYSREALLDEFKKRKKNIEGQTVVIRGDRKANYETIIKVMDDLNRAGIPKFILSTVK